MKQFATIGTNGVSPVGLVGGRNRSGAYMYDLAFLHPSGKRDGEPFQKKALEIENFTSY